MHRLDQPSADYSGLSEFSTPRVMKHYAGGPGSAFESALQLPGAVIERQRLDWRLLVWANWSGPSGRACPDDRAADARGAARVPANFIAAPLSEYERAGAAGLAL